MAGAEIDTGKSGTERLFALLIGVVPMLMTIAPLSFSPQPAGWQIFVRSQSLIVTATQILLILLVMRMGGSVLTGWQGLPRLTKWSVALALPIMVMVTYQPGNHYLFATLGLMRLFVLALLALALASLSEKQLSGLLRGCWPIVGIGVLIYLAIFCAYILANDLKGMQWIEHMPGFNNIRHVAFLGFVAFAVGLGCRVAAAKGSSMFMRRYLPFVFAGLGMVLPLWSGSRGPLLACMILSVLGWLLLKSERRFVAYYAIGTIGFAFVVTLVLPSQNAIFGAAQAFGVADVGAESANTISSGRLELWEGTLRHIMERPILGWGINQFSLFEPIAGEVFFHPHCFPLQLLHASGLFGLAVVFAATLPLVIRSRQLLKSAQGSFHAALFGALAIYSLYDGIFYFAYPMMISMLAFLPFLRPTRA